MGPVIAALDFSAPAIEAAKAACRLAAALNTFVEVVHVVPDMPVLMRWRVHSETAMRDRVEAARDQLDTVTRSLGCGSLLRRGWKPASSRSSWLRRRHLRAHDGRSLSWGATGRAKRVERPDLLRIGC